MGLKANRMTVGVLVALLSVGASRSAVAAPTNPPPGRAESGGRAPSAGAAWVPGFWDLRDDPASAARAGWVWVPGRWIEPPVPNATWDPGHWGWSNNWYTWIPAHWVVPGRHGYPPDLQSDRSTELEMSAP